MASSTHAVKGPKVLVKWPKIDWTAEKGKKVLRNRAMN
jgi:hypothetical protein